MNIINNLFITKICGIYTVNYDTSIQLEMKDRAWYGLSFAISGKIIYKHKNMEYVSDPEHAVLFPMNASYVLDCQIPGQFTLVNFLCSPDYKQEEFISIPLTSNAHFLKNHTLLESLDYFHNPYNQPRFISILYDSLSMLQDTLALTTLHPILKPALQYITAHLHDSLLNNAQIAAELGISEVYFRKLFKQNFHISPMQHIQQLRIKKAQELLSYSSESVTSVAVACGYSSIYHFCRIFKEKTGYTPTKYRDQYKFTCL